jgi:hypothetical protein
MTRAKRAGSMAQAVEHLSSKHESLSLSPCTGGGRRGEGRREKGEEGGEEGRGKRRRRKRRGEQERKHALLVKNLLKMKNRGEAQYLQCEDYTEE